MNVVVEVSNSEDGEDACDASKRPRYESDQDSSASLKGVVSKRNGQWGAQICFKKQKTWLGTFESEKEAAMAYDNAANSFQSEEFHTKFRPKNLTVFHEPNTQTLHENGDPKTSQFKNLIGDHREFSCREMFHKELTPSDVGKLNRLVIPIKYAVKYFPTVDERKEGYSSDGSRSDFQLVFYDNMMKSWKFRYCYWRSSQSFVFTRGWNRFVKEKELKAKDVVTFYECECTKDGKNKKFSMIGVCYKGENNKDYENKELQLSIGNETKNTVKEFEKKETTEMERNIEDGQVKLFGVYIQEGQES